VTKLIPALIIITLLFGCGNAFAREKLVDPKIFNRGGLMYLARSEVPLTADVVFWYDSGQLNRKYTVINGKREGLFRMWHNNGQISQETTYRDGKREGLFRSWWTDGQIRIETTFKNDKIDGLKREWFKNGMRKEESTYENGVKIES
jgi:antitoxin component YwqK of YwqJK toxin-antitoxin module